MEVNINNQWTIKNIILCQKKEILRINYEYQRGARWKKFQCQMFIDSILRGYSIPAFYFHKKVMEGSNERFFEIVDGQQRLNAIKDYCNDSYKLLNPNNGAGTRFPNFLEGEECPWGGKLFCELPDNLKKKLLNHQLVVYEINTPYENHIRDLFIRLQGGTPLTPQDKRDSWPGNFTDFILRVGGKTDLAGRDGLPLFNEIAKVTNESNRRQLVAQIFMLYQKVQKETKFCDIDSPNIDRFYHNNVGFNCESREVKNFLSICEKLYAIFRNKQRLFGHYLIHLVLLVNELSKEYVKGWEPELAKALHEFETRRKQAATNVKNKIDDEVNQYFDNYGRLTQTQSNQTHQIRHRHAFFVEKMLEFLSPQKLDNRNRLSNLERQTIFFRDAGLCQRSRMKGDIKRVSWDSCEIYHFDSPYLCRQKSIKNAALIHPECHPKNANDVIEFAHWWLNRFQNLGTEGRKKRRQYSSQLPPNGTKMKMSYKGIRYTGEIIEKSVVLDINGGIFDSLSAASSEISGTPRNGWRDWFICLPKENNWQLADNWRKKCGMYSL